MIFTKIYSTDLLEQTVSWQQTKRLTGSATEFQKPKEIIRHAAGNIQMWNRTQTHWREDVCVVAANGVGFAAVGGLRVELLSLVVVGGGALLLLLLLLVAIAVVSLTNPHHLHPPLLPADDDCGGQREVGERRLLAFALCVV